MNDVQARLLAIFEEFKRVCSELGLRYFACGGTLLGAIRHKGFIPWDDDMDFYMLREDYERLINEGAKLFQEPFFLQCHATEPEWWMPFIKIRDSSTTCIEPFYSTRTINQGLWIDVWALDSQPSDINMIMKDEKERRLRRDRTCIFYNKTLSWRRKIYNLFLILYAPSLKYNFKCYEKLAKKYNKRSNMSKLGTIWDDKTDGKLLFDKELFCDAIQVPFENVEISIPIGAKKLLQQQYGDWQTPPPENQRNNSSGHTISLINLDKSYKNIK